MQLLIDSQDVKDKINIDKNLVKGGYLNDIRDLDVNLDLNSNLEIATQKSNFSKIVNDVIDKGTSYVIKALPVNKGVKNILLNVKEAFKTKDFKEIVKVAINSSIKEGLEMVGMPVSVIKDITKLKDIALKGGLKQALVAGIDITANKYLKNNLFADILKDFFDRTKQFLNSNEFLVKIDNGISKLKQKVDNFKKLCDNWNKSYQVFDLAKLNDLSERIKKYRYSKILDYNDLNKTKVIPNITTLANTKKSKLSNTQLEVCETLS